MCVEAEASGKTCAVRFVMRYTMHYTARRIVRPVIRGGGWAGVGWGWGWGTWLSLVRSVQKPGAPRDWTTLTSPDHTPVLPSRANVDTLAPPITGSSTVSQVRVLDADLEAGQQVKASGGASKGLQGWTAAVALL